MCFALGGGAYKSDRYMVNFERRGRAQLLDDTTRQRYEVIYGDKGAPSASASSSNTTSAPSSQ